MRYEGRATITQNGTPVAVTCSAKLTVRFWSGYFHGAEPQGVLQPGPATITVRNGRTSNVTITVITSPAGGNFRGVGPWPG